MALTSGKVSHSVVFLLSVTLPASMLVPASLRAEDIAGLKKGVVKITSQGEGMTKVGTGFIVRLDQDLAYILTAAHVIGSDQHPEVAFFTKPHLSVRATVVDKELSEDVASLALLVIQRKENIPPGLAALSVASAAELSEGEDIIVIGHPREIGDWAILGGKAANRKGRNVIVDANIEEGNSGGPMIKNGQVVGLVAGRGRYGIGVTAGSIREYLDGHRIFQEATPPSVAKVLPTPRLPSEAPKTTLDREITGKDGAPMVLIPAGEFWMGSPDGEGNKNEHPRHRVSLDAFYMDKFEVTVSRYAEFLRATGRQSPEYWHQVSRGKHDKLPVIGVDWNDAYSYCRWAGKRLPTEAEWEKAARGTDGRTYPWGREEPTSRLANFGKPSSKGYEGGLAPVESYEPGKSPYGLYHMAGNVWEWVADWYDESYYTRSPERNPTGPSSGQYRVLRGGSWGVLPEDVRSVVRIGLAPSYRLDSIGFRCARDGPQ